MSAVTAPAALDRPGATAPAFASRRGALSWGLLVVLGALLWAFSLSSIEVDDLGQYGLLPALPVLWYVGLACAVLGATAAAITGRLLTAALGVAVVVAILFATLPAVTEVPQYLWIYKHIGVTRLIMDNGGPDWGQDIYNRWPGFFWLSALVSDVTGADPQSYAAWAEPLFAGLGALFTGWAAVTVTRDRRAAALAALLFVAVNWVAQSYYAPQAFAFTLSLPLMIIVLGRLRHDQGALLGPRAGRVIGAIVRREQDAPEPAEARSRPFAIALVLLLAILIVVSHQLTPYAVVAALVGLTLLDAVRPRWLVLVVGVLTVAYLLPNLDYVQGHFGLFSGFDPLANIRTSKPGFGSGAEPGKQLSEQSGRLLGLVMWLAALVSAVALARRGAGRRALPVYVLFVAPFAVLFGQSYGGEAILRVILYTSPWCAVLIAWAIVRVDRVRLRAAVAGVMVALFTVLFVPAFFGQAELHVLTRAEIQAGEYLYAHAPRGSTVIPAAPGFPFNLGANYPDFENEKPLIPNRPELNVKTFSQADVAVVARQMRDRHTTGLVVFSPLEDKTTRASGFRVNGLGDLEAVVRDSPDFALWYDQQGVRIYRTVEAG